LTLLSGALEQFKNSVDPDKIRLIRRPKIILIFGSGPIGIEDEYRNSSFRNVFLNWTGENDHPLVGQFQLPEYFPEWNRFEGYQNLVEFERDAGALCSAILLFSESEGALAELGAFCMDDVLSERLLVVIKASYFEQDSFVKHGPLRKLIGAHSDASVCVIESEHPKEFYAEAAVVAEALQAKVDDHPRKETFHPARIRDQLLLIADLVELFGALTETELLGLLEFTKVNVDRTTLRRMAGQLKLFRLLEERHQYTQKFLIAPKHDRQSYLDYDAVRADEKFDRTRFKMSSFEQLKKETGRRKAYGQIHGEVAHGSN
jgi:hypothetical protein